MNRLKMCMVAVLGAFTRERILEKLNADVEHMLAGTLAEPTGGYPVTDRHTGKAKERREAKRRRRSKGKK